MCAHGRVHFCPASQNGLDQPRALRGGTAGAAALKEMTQLLPDPPCPPSLWSTRRRGLCVRGRPAGSRQRARGPAGRRPGLCRTHTQRGRHAGSIRQRGVASPLRMCLHGCVHGCMHGCATRWPRCGGSFVHGTRYGPQPQAPTAASADSCKHGQPQALTTASTDSRKHSRRCQRDGMQVD